jgi:TFIIF-interacting CTD phosphatase-like protein
VNIFSQKYTDLDPYRASRELEKAYHDSMDAAFLAATTHQSAHQTMLPSIRPPFLPPKADQARMYTLVLDLDETLVHYATDEHAGDVHSGKFLIRPGAVEFLTEMAKYYEIVIFTAG